MKTVRTNGPDSIFPILSVYLQKELLDNVSKVYMGGDINEYYRKFSFNGSSTLRGETMANLRILLYI